jgi:hypothetical protein
MSSRRLSALLLGAFLTSPYLVRAQFELPREEPRGRFERERLKSEIDKILLGSPGEPQRLPNTGRLRVRLPLRMDGASYLPPNLEGGVTPRSAAIGV